MSDIIRLLPDSVANQIAAGEVVQRPASAVKELLENSLDSGATDIKLIIKDAGKLLIQVMDNGCGMSEGDARMCFERHATSKIRSADDLLSIRTMGFRGEALASIASIAQVELRTRRVEDEVGTSVVVEGSDFKSQGPVTCPTGTSISVKNLFYNVPARRNFLKSNTLELKHIIEAFFRVALVNPDVIFTFYNHDKILHQLPAGNLKQRIINIYGSSYAQRLIPVEQLTNRINITGFVSKPEFARKTRGEQYFFTNGRFMKSPYLHHCVDAAFRELIPDDSLPSYFLYMEVDPQTIDVNIHPTKTEINFQDIQSIYAILQAAVKQAIGKFTLAPSLDFDADPGLNFPPLPEGHPVKPPEIRVNPNFNPFEKRVQPQTSFSFPKKNDPLPGNWQELYNVQPALRVEPEIEGLAVPSPDMSGERPATREKTENIQIRDSFLITYTRSGIVIIDQQHAHERVLYERFLEEKKEGSGTAQRLLIPAAVNLGHDASLMLEEWSDHFHALGFEISDMGNGSVAVHSVPSGTDTSDVAGILESLLESVIRQGNEPDMRPGMILARNLAARLAVRRGRKLQREEIDHLIENLFACQVPGTSPSGKPTMFVVPFADLHTKFKL